MKKTITLLFLLILFTNAVFARKIYSGDIQLNIGGNIFNSVFTSEEFLTSVDADIESWHLFSLSEKFSLGFVAGCSARFCSLIGYAKDDSGNVLQKRSVLDSGIAFDFFSGPAFSIDFDNMRLSAALETSFGFGGLPHRYIFVFAGAGTDVQLIFFPKTSAISPVLGYHFETLFAEVIVFTGGYSILFNNKLFAGISFNW